MRNVNLVVIAILFCPFFASGQSNTFNEVINLELIKPASSLFANWEDYLFSNSDSLIMPKSKFKSILKESFKPSLKYLFEPSQIVDEGLIWNSNSNRRVSEYNFSKKQIRVCFIGYNESSKFNENHLNEYGTVLNKIKEITNEYSSKIGVEFNFDLIKPCQSLNNDSGDIRIIFQHKFNAHWSYIGNDPRGETGATMCLQGLHEADPFKPFFKHIVLHEFGHALGLHHEQRHKEFIETCEIDIQKAMAHFKWSEEEVKTNFSYLDKYDEMYVTDYDSTSIMHYELPQKIFINYCKYAFDDFVTDLSEKDIDALKVFYPNTFEEFKINKQDWNIGLENLRNNLAQYERENNLEVPILKQAIKSSMEIRY